MKTYKQAAREIPVVAETPVLVIGGGPAGFGASLGAATNGKSVLLTERLGFLGGTSTASLVTTFPYRYLLLEDGEKKIYEGVYKIFIDRLVKENAISISPAQTTPWNIYHRDLHGSMIPADPELMKYVYAEMLLDAGVKIMLHTYVVEVIKNESGPTGVIIENASGRQAIMAERMIDATGDADVAAKSDVPFLIGEGDEKQVLPWSLMFFVGNVDTAKLSEYMTLYDPDLHKILRRGEEEGEFIFRDWRDPKKYIEITGQIRVRVYQSMCRPGEVIVHGAHAVGLDATKAEDVTGGELDCRKQMIHLYQFLRKRVPGFEHAYITSSAVKIGIRESRRIVGEYMLRRDEAFQGKRFPDVILRNTAGLFEKRGIVYDVPYRCLVPQKIENLLVAGRCISIDSPLMASMRVIPMCMGTGQVAGTAAALSLDERVPPRNVNIRVLQDLLLRQGVNLGFSVS
jgi:glycine/D-amino acid oxidase-like deaminating enzyme